MTCNCGDWVTKAAALESERLSVQPRCVPCLVSYYEDRARQLRASVRIAPDRSDYFRRRYEAQKATGMCKIKSCGNPSGKFVLCIFHRAGMSGGRKVA